MLANVVTTHFDRHAQVLVSALLPGLAKSVPGAWPLPPHAYRPGHSDARRVVRALDLLEENEQHPSLRMHQLQGREASTW